MSEDKKLSIECVMMLCMLNGDYSIEGKEKSLQHAVNVLTNLEIDIEDIIEATKDLNEKSYNDI
jgi:hypothetical protein